MIESVSSGVIANFVFLVLIALLSAIVWGIRYGKKFCDASHFFGIGSDNKIVIYISSHSDQKTRTKRVITAEEFETVIDSYSNLANQFYSTRFNEELAIFISQLLRFEVKIPDIALKASPLEKVTTPQIGKSLILVGGPTRNQVSKYYLENSNSWLTFDDDKKKFLINRGGRCGEELNPSGKMAILSKIKTNHSTAFLIFGFGEVETKSALNYFVHNWRLLYNEFNENEFGICLLVESEENVQVHLKLSG